MYLLYTFEQGGGVIIIAEQGGKVTNTDRQEGSVYGVKLDQGDSFS